MQVFTARVRNGVIVIDDDVTLPDGTIVTVIAGDAELDFELTPEQEAELAEAIREADAGDVVSAADLLERLRH